MQRHFAFFDQITGNYIREWKGPVPSPNIRWWQRNRQVALDKWATDVSKPGQGEVGLDVTHIGWPVGDFCYCTFDPVDRRLEWGPPRHYVEVSLDTLEVVANTESHRPIRDAVPNQHVFDITSTAWEPYFGHIFGRFQKINDQWTFLPNEDTAIVPKSVQKILAEAPIGLDLFQPIEVHNEVYSNIPRAHA